MGSSTNYHNITQLVYTSVYQKLTPGLQDYVDDQNKNKTDWATPLYNVVSSTIFINGLITKILSGNDMSDVTYYTTILKILNDKPMVYIGTGDSKTKVSYATALYWKVTDGMLKTMSDSSAIKLDSSYKDDLTNFLMLFFTQFWNQLSTGKLNWDEQSIEEAKAEFLAAAQASGFQTTEAYIAHISDIAADAASAILTLNDPNIALRLYNYFNGKKTIPRALAVAFYGFGAMAIFMGFSNWSSLDPAEKADVIANTVSISVSGFKDVATWKACRAFTSDYEELLVADDQIWSAIKKDDFAEAMASGRKPSEILADVGKDISQLSTKGGDIVASASKWQSFLNIADKISKGFSILTMAVGVGLQAYEVYEDFRQGQPPAVKALDIIGVISGGIALIAEGAVILVSGVCAAVPIIGVVACAVGIIVAFVELFIDRKEPTPPIIDFINNKCIPFVNGLNEVPA
jgi:hypothetical protein